MFEPLVYLIFKSDLFHVQKVFEFLEDFVKFVKQVYYDFDVL